jgi:F0F1-type ATP synthase membrane subunit b/b'
MVDSVAFAFRELLGGACLLFLGFAGGAIQLVPDGTLVFHLFIIITMVAVLNYTLLKPINRILADRERLTKGRLEEAERVLADANDKFRIYESTLRDARSSGYLLLESERAKVHKEREQKVKATKDEVGQWVNVEKAKLASEMAEVQVLLRQDAMKISEEIGRRILAREITPKRS